MEAAGVEPASANGSYRASTCVASLSVSPGAASEQPTPKLATWTSHLWPGQHRPATSPTHRRLGDPPRAGRSGNGLRTEVTQPMPAHCWQL